MEKRILKNKWFSAGRHSGFALGVSINKYFISIDLGFWYIGVEL